MGSNEPINSKLRVDYEKPPVNDAARLLELLKNVDVEKLETALTAINNAEEQSPNKDDGAYKHFLEKNLIY